LPLQPGVDFESGEVLGRGEPEAVADSANSSVIADNSGIITKSSGVIAGLDPAIHHFEKSWITGSRAFGAAR
jgi:hypothetical protein